MPLQRHRRFDLGVQQTHSLAANWAVRVVSNGGVTPSAASIASVSFLCFRLDRAGITSKMKSVCCFVPDSVIAATTPLIKNYGNDPWTNTGPFLASELSLSGLKGNGGKYLRTGVIPSTAFASVNDCGLSVYNTIADASATRDLACFVNANSASGLLVDYSGTAYFDAYTDGGTGRVSGVPLTNGLGFTSGSRTDATHQYLYGASSVQAFSQIAFNAGSPGVSLPNIDYWLFTQNNGGAQNQTSSRRYSFAAIHSGLTSTETQDFYNAVQDFRTSLGGGYI